MKTLFVLIAATTSLLSTALAQAPGELGTQPFLFQKPAEWRMEGAPGDQVIGLNYFYAEAGVPEIIVGAPYTATAVTESTQTLADGNRIVNKTTASLARDGQGRTRREEDLGRVGPLQGAGQKFITINDPVAHTNYVFRSGPSIETEDLAKIKMKGELERKEIKVLTRTTGGHPSPEQPSDVKREDLGTQVIEGLSVQGKRETRTIPAGAIGNERPIEVTSETWFSPDLHVIVLSKRNDPRFGETIYKLSDIKRGEPDASLFQAPPGHPGELRQK